jgi:hypothetical protein
VQDLTPSAAEQLDLPSQLSKRDSRPQNTSLVAPGPFVCMISTPERSLFVGSESSDAYAEWARSIRALISNEQQRLLAVVRAGIVQHQSSRTAAQAEGQQQSAPSAPSEVYALSIDGESRVHDRATAGYGLSRLPPLDAVPERFEGDVDSQSPAHPSQVARARESRTAAQSDDEVDIPHANAGSGGQDDDETRAADSLGDGASTGGTPSRTSIHPSSRAQRILTRADSAGSDGSAAHTGLRNQSTPLVARSPEMLLSAATAAALAVSRLSVRGRSAHLQHLLLQQQTGLTASGPQHTSNAGSHHSAADDSLRSGKASSSQGGIPASSSLVPALPLPNAWELQLDDVELDERIGKGTYGEVFKGRLWGTDVAVKRLLSTTVTPEVLDNLKAEVATLSQLRHPNVVLFLGACTAPPDVCIVTEWAERGSLHDQLYDPTVPMSAVNRIGLALQTAQGMCYLQSSHGIIHRDL